MRLLDYSSFAPLSSQQLAQQRTMAARLVFAITADREIGVMRERGQHVERLARGRRRHFRAILSGEGRPLPVGFRGPGRVSSWRRSARGPETRRRTSRGARNPSSARRAAAGAQCRAACLRWRARSTQPHDTHAHRTPALTITRLSTSGSTVAGKHAGFRIEARAARIVFERVARRIEAVRHVRERCADERSPRPRRFRPRFP